jgi:hypothetical protein
LVLLLKPPAPRAPFSTVIRNRWRRSLAALGMTLPHHHSGPPGTGYLSLR